MSDKYHIFKFMSQIQCHSKLFTIPLYKPKKNIFTCKVKNRRTGAKCKTCSSLTIKTPEQCHCLYFGHN